MQLKMKINNYSIAFNDRTWIIIQTTCHWAEIIKNLINIRNIILLNDDGDEQTILYGEL
jgi:hypothetical protein